jgi:hypothetical protein
MNALGLGFLVLAAMLVVALPRRLAPLPILASAAWMTGGQMIDIGGATFTVPRVLVAIGVLRVLMRSESLAGGFRTLDLAMFTWAGVLLCTSAFHTSDAWLFRSGIIWTELGCYLLFRAWLTSADDVLRAFRMTGMLLLPVAILMLLEKSSGYNIFGLLGGVSEYSPVREGHVRATGPFAHPILAGSVGAVCFAAGCAQWLYSRRAAMLTAVVGLAIVFASTSSGPVMMVLFFCAAIAAWPARRHMAIVRVLIAMGIAGLAAVMKDPVYFLMARIDISGGSQGYYRSQLIRSSIEHLDEWWLAGTDYTRHWMSSGIHANDRHADITNHFLAMGVMGGLLLIALLVLILFIAFRDVGRSLRIDAQGATPQAMLKWCCGAMLFSFLANFFTISMFDQSIMFFYLLLASIQALSASPLEQAMPQSSMSRDDAVHIGKTA